MMNDPQRPLSPGERIRSLLREREWTQEDLARVLGRPLGRVNEIIQGKQAISVEVARSLAAAFGDTPEDWLQAEAAYRLAITPVDVTLVRRRAHLFQSAPIKEMQRRGWLTDTEDLSVVEAEVERFFQADGDNLSPSGAMRKTGPNAALSPSQLAWFYRVRQVAGALRIGAFDPERLSACRDELRKLAAYSAEVRKVPAVLGKFGIRFVVVEPLGGSKVDGVATWLSEDKPVIGMSARFDRIDWFWFTLAHEFAHIVHRDVVPLDADVGGAEAGSESEKPMIERRADEEAAAMFISSKELNSFILRVKPLYSKEKINQLANKIKLHPGIIVGQLQHRKEVGYHAHRDSLVKVRSYLTETAVTDGWGQSIDPKVFQ